MRFEQWLYRIPLRVRSLIRRREVERELDDELRYHLERQIEQNIAAGMSVRGARSAARRAIGGIERRKDECRDAWGVALLDNLVRDTRYALRSLRRDAGFTTGAVLLLALGIGANVAVFSIVNGILLSPLPYPESDRLVVVQERIPELDETPRPVNVRHFLEWQSVCDCFEDIALYEYVQLVNLAGDGDPERVPAMRVTANTFSVLGVSAQIGRTFAPGDARPGPAEVVVISDRLWRRRFGADPGIVGQTISLDGVQAAVIGVLPPGFRHDGGRGGQNAVDLYAPWSLLPLPPWWGWSNNYSYTALARLADGVSARAALEELDGIQAAIAADHFEDGLSLRAGMIPLRDWATGASREGLLLLLAAVGAALLVACLNIANLMLVRASARGREAGVRAALGASRIGIFRSVLIESAVLALAGTAAGVGVAAIFLKFFASIAPAALPRVDEVQMDWTVLVAATGLAVAATVSFGLLPALRMTRVDPQDALRANTRAFSDSGGRLRFRHALVSVEVAVSACLLIVAGLLVTSFVRLDGVARGFDADNVLTASISLPGARYADSGARLRFYQSLLEGLRSSPGVVAAGTTSALPLAGGSWGANAIPAGENPPANERPSVQYRFVSPGYFEAMGIPLFAGRLITASDDARNVAVVSEGAARRLWAHDDPLGRRFWRSDPDETFEVVGLVPDVHSEDFASDPAPLIYAPLTATGAGGVLPFASVAVRTAGDPAIAAGTLRNVVGSLDRELAISSVWTMRQIERAALDERRFQLLLTVVFAAASLLIAALGIYSVLAYAVTSRAREIAIRLALGARESAVRAMVLRQGLRPVLFGLLLGVAGAFALGRFLSSLLYSVTPTDPATLTAVVTIVLGAALLASWLPARRASRMSPHDALRYE